MALSAVLRRIEEAYAKEEQRLEGKATELEAIHGPVMPRTYVGSAYGERTYQGQPIPRVFVMSINQSRQGQDVSDDEVRQSMRNILQDEDGRFKPDGFGPRALAANLMRWILMHCGVDGNSVSAEDVHSLIAYDNYVKWPFNRPNSEPPEDAWRVFDGVNSKIIEILEPDIILSLGRPMYDRIYEALNASTACTWDKVVSGWCYTVRAPWARCGVGWCYHYSNPIWPNCHWKELREEGKLPQKAMGLWEGAKPSAEEAVRAMKEVEENKDRYPWWGEETYVGSAFTGYNAYQKWVAWQVCGRLADGWRQS